MLESAAMYLSLIMAVYLFAFSYIEGLKLSDSEEKVYGGTFILTVVSAFLFSGFTFSFYQ